MKRPKAPTLERRVLDALPVTVYTVDLDGRIILMNRSWLRFAQNNGAPQLCNEDAVIGTSLWDALVDPSAREEVRDAMTTLREGRATSLSWEFPCNSPDEERVFLMQITALGDTAVDGYVFSTVDITPSHRSREVLIDTGMALARTISVERVLQEVTQQLRRAMGCDGVAIALADDGTAVPRLAHHAGFTGTDTDLDSRLLASWNDAMQRRELVTVSVGDGVEITAPMLRADDQPIGAVTMTLGTVPPAHRLVEVARVLATIAAETAAAIERAWLVRRVEHKRRLEAIGEVSAGVAHELRNPLFGISSAAQLLRFRVKDDPMVEKNVGRILREVERLNNMVTSLLEYGRPHPVKLAAGNPDDVWDEVLENQRGLLESKALLLERVRATPSTHCAIDTEQLAQVFLNLLVNATDAAPEGSDLQLHSTVLPNGAWRCQLHNGGPAIAPDVLPRVFEIFFSTKTGGTGIGLALCQRIIEEHGGTIALESAPDAGTSAIVVLPAS